MGIPVPLITITSEKNMRMHSSRRKYVVITSRVHSGESLASYVMKGIIDYLVSPAARNARDKYIFKLIPILNADGVTSGNYRSSIVGLDLNRIWKEADPRIHPEIFYTKEMIKELHSSG